jgi:16S rRNA processing protein RimM
MSDSSATPTTDKKKKTDKPPSTFRDEWVVVGQVVGVMGIKGELKLKPEDEDPDWLESDCPLFFKKAKQDPVELTVSDYRWKGSLLIISVDEIQDRTEAETWVGSCMCLKPEDLPEPEEGSYRLNDLVGLTVIGKQDGQTKGKVSGLLSSTAGDFLEIELPHHKQKALVSFQDELFPDINLENKTILLDKITDLTPLVEHTPTASKKAPEKRNQKEN